MKGEDEDEAGGAEDDPLEDVEPLKFTPQPPKPNLTEEQQGVQDSLDSGEGVETDPFKMTPTPAQKPPAPPEEELPTEAEIEDSNPDLASDSKVLEDAKPSLPPIKQIPKTEENPFQYKAPTQEEAFSEAGGTTEDTLPTMTNEEAQSLVQSFSTPKFDPTAPVEGEFTGTGGAYKGAGGQTIKQGETPEEGAGAGAEPAKLPDSLPSLDELEEEQKAKAPAPEEEAPLEEEESIPKLGEVGNPLIGSQAPAPPPPVGGEAEGEVQAVQGTLKESQFETAKVVSQGENTGSGALTATKGDVDSSIESGGIDMGDKAPFPAGRPPPPEGQMYNEAGELVDAEEEGLSTALAGSLAGDFNPIGFLITAGIGLATVFSPLFHKKFTANAGNPLNPSAQFGAT